MVKVLLPIGDLKENEIDMQSVALYSKFGKSANFLAIDSGNGEFQVIPNHNHHFGGTESIAEMAQKAGVSVIIATHMGDHQFVELGAKNLKIAAGRPGDKVTELLEKLGQNQLPALERSAQHSSNYHDHQH